MLLWTLCVYLKYFMNTSNQIHYYTICFHVAKDFQFDVLSPLVALYKLHIC